MQQISNTASLAARAMSGRLSVWNRRLMAVASLVILLGATMLGLQAAGPHARAMIAGEGIWYGEVE
jgi:hypothetical protein